MAVLPSYNPNKNIIQKRIYQNLFQEAVVQAQVQH